MHPNRKHGIELVGRRYPVSGPHHASSSRDLVAVRHVWFAEDLQFDVLLWMGTCKMSVLCAVDLAVPCIWGIRHVTSVCIVFASHLWLLTLHFTDLPCNWL